MSIFKKIFLIICVLTCCLTIWNNSKVYSDENDYFYQNEFTTEIWSIDKTGPGITVSFIYIPAKNDHLVSNKIRNAMIAAKEALEIKGISTQLYSLTYESSDCRGISMTTTLPAVLITYRTNWNYYQYHQVIVGKYYVAGNITKETLLQGVISASKDGVRVQ